MLVPMMAEPISSPRSVHNAPLPTLPCCLLERAHPNQHEGEPCCSLIGISLVSVVLTAFPVPVSHLYLLWESLSFDPLPVV